MQKNSRIFLRLSFVETVLSAKKWMWNRSWEECQLRITGSIGCIAMDYCWWTNGWMDGWIGEIICRRNFLTSIFLSIRRGRENTREMPPWSRSYCLLFRLTREQIRETNSSSSSSGLFGAQNYCVCTCTRLARHSSTTWEKSILHPPFSTKKRFEEGQFSLCQTGWNFSFSMKTSSSLSLLFCSL